MAEQSHTPGPWSAHKTIEAHDGMPECWQIDAQHDAVCTTQFCYAPNTAANARLIAAAPELLEALKRLSVQMNNLIMVCDVPERFAEAFNDGQNQADAAIAKATGGSNEGSD